MTLDDKCRYMLWVTTGLLREKLLGVSIRLKDEVLPLPDHDRDSLVEQLDRALQDATLLEKAYLD